MGRYETYAMWMARLAKACRFVWRFKFVFIGVGAVGLATGAVLVGSKGAITEQELPAPTFIYGQPAKYSASAFGSDVRYEFAPKGSEEWSLVVPESVGSYKMRVVSQGSFGEVHGSEHYFEILPKEASVEVAESDIVYGQGLTYRGIDLLPGHVLKEATVGIKEYKAETTAYVRDAVIVDQEGIDVTGNYSLTYRETDLQIHPRPLTLAQGDASYVYDGQDHLSSDAITIKQGNLVEGDALSFVPAAVPSQAGVARGVGTFAIHHGEEDRTALYAITFLEGKVTTAKRALSLDSSSFSKTYDGLPITREERGEIAVTNLVEGDALEKAFTGDEATWLFPGTYPNEFTYTADEENYQVTKTVGNIVISERPLHVHIDGERAYAGGDLGGALTEEEYSFLDDTSLAYGDRLEITIAEDQVFSSTPKYDVKVMRNETDVTPYYVLSVDGGLVFKKQAIVATGSTEEFVYDGKTHALSYEVSGLLDADKATIEWSKDGKPEEGDYAYGTSLLAPGAIYATPKFTKLTSALDETIDRAPYYEYASTTATLTVSKRPLSVLLSGERTYDGTYSLYRDLTEDEYSFTAGTSLAEGDTLQIKPVASTIFDDVPKYEYHVFNEKGVDVTATCYDVTLAEESKIAYNRHTITLAASSEEFVYDGKPHELSFTKEGEIEGETYTYAWDKNVIAQTDVGILTANVSLSRVHSDALDMDVTPFFTCEKKQASVKITARPLDITLAVDRAYNGQNLGLTFNQTSPEVTVASGENVGLAEGHRFVLAPKGGKTALNYLNGEALEWDVTVYDAQNADVTKNYVPSVSSVTFAFAKADALELTVDKSIAESAVFYHSTRTLQFRSNVAGLQNGDRLIASYDVTYGNSTTTRQLNHSNDGMMQISYYAPAQAGDYLVSLSSKSVTQNNASRANCYASFEDPASVAFTVKPRPITLTFYAYGANPAYEVTSSVNDGYDGNPLGNDTLTYQYVKHDDGSYTYTYDIKRSGVSVASNYVITENYAPFPKQVFTVTCQPQELLFGPEYNMEGRYTLSAPLSVTWKKNSAPSDEKFYAPTAEPLPFGNGWAVEKLVDGSGRDVTSVYDVVIVPSTVSIAKRTLNIAAKGTRTYGGRTLGYALDSMELTLTGNGLYDTDSLAVTPVEATILDNGAISDDNVEFTYKITNAKKQDVTAYYDIAFSSTMVFEGRTLHVSATPDEELEYDRKEHTPTVVVTGLAGADKASIVYQGGQTPKVKNPGDSVSYVVEGVKVTNGNESRDKYYQTVIDEPNGNLSIGTAYVQLDLGEYVGVYDGVTSYNMADYLSLRKVTITGQQAGHYVAHLGFKDFVVSQPGVTMLDERCVDLDSLQILDESGNDVTHLYSVEMAFGSVELVGFSFEVYANSLTKVYDGVSLDESGLSFTTKGWTSQVYDLGSVDYDVLVTFEPTSITSVGATSVAVASVEVRKNGYLVDTVAYTYVAYPGTLEVLAREITLYTGNFTDEVGYPVDAGGSSSYGVAKGSLASGDRIVVVHAPSSRVYDEAGTYVNDGWEFQIVNALGEDVTGNYSVSIQWGTITILDI